MIETILCLSVRPPRSSGSCPWLRQLAPSHFVCISKHIHVYIYIYIYNVSLSLSIYRYISLSLYTCIYIYIYTHVYTHWGSRVCRPCRHLPLRSQVGSRRTLDVIIGQTLHRWRWLRTAVFTHALKGMSTSHGPPYYKALPFMGTLTPAIGWWVRLLFGSCFPVKVCLSHGFLRLTERGLSPEPLLTRMTRPRQLRYDLKWGGVPLRAPCCLQPQPPREPEPQVSSDLTLPCQ